MFPRKRGVFFMCVCVLTLSGRVKLLRQQVIAAAHAADCGELRFSHKHPQGAGSQVATRVQADHDRILEFRRERERAEKGENRRRGGGERSGWGGDRWENLLMMTRCRFGTRR